MNKLNLTHLVAPSCDADVELVYHAIDVEIGHTLQHPAYGIRPKPEPSEHLGGEWNGVYRGGAYEGDLPRCRVGVGVDALGENAGHGDDLPLVQDVVADAKSRSIHKS